MSLAKRIAMNSAALLATNVANKLTGFLIMLSIARFLGAERFGLYSYVFAYVAAFSLATDLGLTTVVIRGISQGDEKGRAWLGHALLIRWLFALLSCMAAFLCALSFYGRVERTWLIALSSLSFLTAPLATSTAVFNARLMLYGPALVSLASRLVLFAVIQWIARSGGSLAALIGSEVLLGSLANIFLWLWSRSLLRPVFRLDVAAVRQMLGEGVPLFMTSVFVALYLRIDVFFLGHYWSETAIGIYAAAYRLTEALPLVASAVASSIFPVMCQQVHEGNEIFLVKLVRISLKILLAGIVPVVMLLSFYSNLVTRLLYGTRFEGSATLLAILAWGEILVFANILFSTLIIARGKSGLLMRITFGMLVLNVALNYLIIPIYGAVGAALTTVGTELVGTVVCLAATSMTRPLVLAVSRLLVPVAACGFILGVAARGSQAWNIQSLWPAIAIGILYPVSIYLFRVFDMGEWRGLRELVWPQTR